MKNRNLKALCISCGIEIELRKLKLKDCLRYDSKKKLVVFFCKCGHLLTYKGYKMDDNQLERRSLWKRIIRKILPVI